MLIAKDFVYLELQKTGCTHIRSVLKDLVGGEVVGKHNRANATLFDAGKTFLGSIRDPWEWYISLWAYGCDRKGEIFKQVTRPKVALTKLNLKALEWKRDPYNTLLVLLADSVRNPDQWQKTYRDVNDAGAFREWLRMIHDPACIRGIKGYGSWSMNQFVGLLTFRYLKLYCTRVENPSAVNVSTLAQLQDYERQHCFVDCFIRNEDLEASLFQFLELSGNVLSTVDRERVVSRPRTNRSSREKQAEFYYDQASEHLVAARDQLIIDKFGYVPPSSKAAKPAGTAWQQPLPVG